MTGYTCRAHVATVIKGRVPVLCPRWIPGFATCCTECGTERDRWLEPLLVAARARTPGSVDRTMKRMAEQTAALRARRDAQRALARGSRR